MEGSKTKKDFLQSVAMAFSIQFCPCIFMHGLFLHVIKLPCEASFLFLPSFLFYFLSSLSKACFMSCMEFLDMDHKIFVSARSYGLDFSKE